LGVAYSVLEAGGMYCALFGELLIVVGLNRFWQPPWTVPFKAP